MPRVAPVAYEAMEPAIQEIVKASDEALGVDAIGQSCRLPHPK